jgi:hypothetical protein
MYFHSRAGPCLAEGGVQTAHKNLIGDDDEDTLKTEFRNIFEQQPPVYVTKFDDQICVMNKGSGFKNISELCFEHSLEIQSFLSAKKCLWTIFVSYASTSVKKALQTAYQYRIRRGSCERHPGDPKSPPPYPYSSGSSSLVT